LPVDPLNPSSFSYASSADVANLNHVNATASAVQLQQLQQLQTPPNTRRVSRHSATPVKFSSQLLPLSSQEKNKPLKSLEHSIQYLLP